MSDAWSSLAPSVTASVITSLVTYFSVEGIRLRSRRKKLNANPMKLVRQPGDTWNLVNQSPRDLTGVSGDVSGPLTERRTLEVPSGILRGAQGQWIGPLNEGDEVTVVWVITKRGSRDRKRTYTARLRGDVDELDLRLMPQQTIHS